MPRNQTENGVPAFDHLQNSGPESGTDACISDVPGCAWESFGGNAEKEIISKAGQLHDGFARGRMVFRQCGHECADADFALAQARGIGFVRKTDKSGVQPALKNGASLLERRKVEKVDGRLWTVPAKAFKNGRYQGMKQSPNVAEVQLSVARITGVTRDVYGLFAMLENGASFGEERLARFCEMDSVAGAFEQPDTQFVFELANLAAQGRLRHMQFLRRPGEVKLTGHTGKIAQMTQFHDLTMPGRHHDGNKEVLGGKWPKGHYVGL